MKIGIVGCAGRMGCMLSTTVLETAGADLIGGTEQPGNPTIGEDLGTLVGAEPLGVLVGVDPKALFTAADAVIDFTIPAATVSRLSMPFA